MKENRGRSKKISIIVIGIIFCIIMMMPKNIYAATIDLSKDKEMQPIILELCEWEINFGYDNGRDPTASEIAVKAVELCGEDKKKVEKLQNTYTVDGIEYWHGDKKDSPHRAAADQANDSIKNNTQISAGNAGDEQKLLNELSAIVNIAYDDNASIEDLQNLDKKLKEYKDKYGLTQYWTEVANKVGERLKSKGETGSTTIDEVEKRDEEREEFDRAQASTGKLGSPTDTSTVHTPDEIITEANQFVQQGTTSPINGDQLKGASSTLYNLLLSIGIFLSVAIGVYLGVKFMLSTAEDKAKVKEALIPYIVGCIVIFSAFIIWKVVIELLGAIA